MSTKIDEVFDVLSSPAAEVLAPYGITLKPKGHWLNLSWCPWCGHGREKGDNYQCGISESLGERGLLHAVNCMHAHDSPTGQKNPHYADFLAELGAITQDDADAVRALRAQGGIARAKAKGGAENTNDAAADNLARMSIESNDKMRRRLRDSDPAMRYLTEVRGLSQATIERFKLGLSEPYESSGKLITEHALVAPLVGFDGGFYRKYVNYAVPGVTTDNRDKPQKAWSPGPARSYYNADVSGKKWLFVCDGLKDVWALHQILEGHELQDTLALVSSTNGGGGLPSEWRNPNYWQRFEQVFAGHDNDKANPLTGKRAGDEHAKKLAEVACCDIRRVTPPGVKDWNDWMLAGGNADAFKRLLEAAENINVVEPFQADDGKSLGRFAADPVAIVGEYHNGYLYQAVRTLVRDKSEASGDIVESYSTIVVRSDRTQHRAQVMPAPKGTAEHFKVWRLTPDGTLLSRSPEPNPQLTWQWSSIKAYLEGKNKPTQLKQLISQVQNHLRGSVWMPNEHDFAILACAAVASYVQEVFDAVPLLLVTGPAGSGKSEIGEALRWLGANSRNVLGAVSAATLARHIDATRGLVVIDDLEQIGSNSAKDGQFDDLAQTLKLSYKKSTAHKMVTEFKNGTAFQREFNFFGIKVINNTRGADEILGSRMLKIHMRHKPPTVEIDKSLKLPPDALIDLRNQLHTWAFSNVPVVAETYQTIFPNKTGRQDEIEAPLRVIAALSGDETLADALEKALAKQKAVVDPYSPEEIMRQALGSIVRRSIEQDGVAQTWVTVTQLIMEMSMLVDVNYGKDFTTSLASIEKPEWVGRTLTQRYADPDTKQARTTMYGKTLRAYRLQESLIAKIVDEVAEEAPTLVEVGVKYSDDFKSFCRACPDCTYRFHCEIQALRKDQDAAAAQEYRRASNGG